MGVGHGPAVESGRGVMRKLVLAGLGVVALGVAGVQAQDAIKRTPLQKVEFPSDPWVTQTMVVEIAAGATVPRHTHPGIEVTYVMEGEGDLLVQGQPDRHLKAGDSFNVPAGVPHSARNTGAVPERLLVTYVVDKTKPLASPAP
jgi:quercetin dioxygenase-like cupin family protein